MIKSSPGGSVVKSLRKQEAGVWSRIWEHLTYRGASKPVCYNCWACAPEPAGHNSWAHMPNYWSSRTLETLLCNKRSHHNEKPMHQNESSLPSLQLEKSPCSTEDPEQPEIKEKRKLPKAKRSNDESLEK